MSVDLSLVEAAHENNPTKITSLISKLTSQQSTDQSTNQQLSPALARDVGGRSALHYASINGNLELAQFVINQNNKAVTQSTDQSTAVDQSTNPSTNQPTSQSITESTSQSTTESTSQSTNHAVVDIINALDGQGQSALHLALANDHLSVARLLLNQSINLSIRSVDAFGRLPLHWAARFGYVDLIDRLVDGVNVNQQTQSGETPLFWLVERSIDQSTNQPINQTNCESIARKLLDHGADPSIKNHRDISSIMLAETKAPSLHKLLNQSINQSNNQSINQSKPSASIGINLSATSSSSKPPAKKMKITLKQKS